MTRQQQDKVCKVKICLFMIYVSVSFQSKWAWCLIFMRISVTTSCRYGNTPWTSNNKHLRPVYVFSCRRFATCRRHAVRSRHQSVCRNKEYTPQLPGYHTWFQQRTKKATAQTLFRSSLGNIEILIVMERRGENRHDQCPNKKPLLWRLILKDCARLIRYK